MKKLITLALLSSTAPFAAMADNQIGELFYSKYDSSVLEVHFNTPDNRTGVCNVQVREASYPNTVWLREESRNEPGSPSSARQWADFSVPRVIRPEAKQIRVTCPTTQGTVQKIVNLPAPPKITFTVNGVKNADGTYSIEGGAYVEGNATGTYCTALHTGAIVDRPLFTADLGAVGGYYATYINVSDKVDSLYHGYGQARFECKGQGGTTLEMLEFYDNGEQGLEFSQSTLTWY